jgi:hypothetical protein
MNRVIPAVLLVPLALAGCAPAGDQAGQETTTTTTSTTTTEPTSPSLRAECVAVADQGEVLLTEVGRLATGDSTVADVRAAADSLSGAFEDAKSALGPGAQDDLDQAGQALQRVLDVLGAQPLDKDALQRAASDLVAAAGDAAAVCTTGESTSDTTTTDTTDTTPDVTTTS